MTTKIDLTELIPRCHEASKANGWWEPRPDAGQQLMLIVSELSEALEADRTGKDKTGLPAYYRLLAEAEAGGQAIWGEATSLEQRRQELFKWKVKDTVADELADAYIRLCDFVGGFAEHFELDALTQWYVLRSGAPVDIPANFGAALLDITVYLPMMQDWGSKSRPHIRAAANIAARLEALCKREGIDLATHIDLKLSYNATRGYKHNGKAY